MDVSTGGAVLLLNLNIAQGMSSGGDTHYTGSIFLTNVHILLQLCLTSRITLHT